MSMVMRHGTCEIGVFSSFQDRLDTVTVSLLASLPPELLLGLLRPRGKGSLVLIFYYKLVRWSRDSMEKSRFFRNKDHKQDNTSLEQGRLQWGALAQTANKPCIREMPSHCRSLCCRNARTSLTSPLHEFTFRFAALLEAEHRLPYHPDRRQSRPHVWSSAYCS